MYNAITGRKQKRGVRRQFLLVLVLALILQIAGASPALAETETSPEIPTITVEIPEAEKVI